MCGVTYVVIKSVTDVVIRQPKHFYNVPRIDEVAWYPEGVDKYLENCITIYQIFVKGNLPQAKTKPLRIFAVIGSKRQSSTK